MTRYYRVIENHPRFGRVCVVRMRNKGSSYYSSDLGLSWWQVDPTTKEKRKTNPPFDIKDPKCGTLVYSANKRMKEGRWPTP